MYSRSRRVWQGPTLRTVPFRPTLNQRRTFNLFDTPVEWNSGRDPVWKGGSGNLSSGRTPRRQVPFRTTPTHEGGHLVTLVRVYLENSGRDWSREVTKHQWKEDFGTESLYQFYSVVKTNGSRKDPSRRECVLEQIRSSIGTLDSLPSTRVLRGRSFRPVCP